jgi:Family of unknown function (DUF6496)
MPKQKTVEKARRAKREGKAASTQAGQFVREEIRKIRRGTRGARSPAQAIAIGLSEARRAGVDLPPPRKGRVKETTRRSAEYAYEVGQHKRKPKHRPRVARAVSRVMKKEPRDIASREALSRHAKAAALRRKASKKTSKTSDRSVAAKKPGARRPVSSYAASRRTARIRKRRTA